MTSPASRIIRSSRPESTRTVRDSSTGDPDTAFGAGGSSGTVAAGVSEDRGVSGESGDMEAFAVSGGSSDAEAFATSDGSGDVVTSTEVTATKGAF